MARFAYVLLSYLLAPFVAAFLAVRGLRNPAYLDRFGERFGFSQVKTESCIWVHAVSVGEVQAAIGLVRALRARYPLLPLVVSTVTPTGAQRVVDVFKGDVDHVYAPYDLPGAVKRFFDRIRPRIAIIIETELWPNLYQECGKRDVPLVLASARISPRSVGRYRRFVSLFSEALSHGIVIAAQSETDAERFRSLGAAAQRTHTIGNIKFDLEPSSEVRQLGVEIRQQHLGDRHAWVAGSTHEGEELLMIEAWRLVRQRIRDCLLVLAPRHPERFPLVLNQLREHGLKVVTRSSRQRCDATTDVFLVDTLGELTAMYAAAEIAFVGGSLVPIGGHNLLEPAALGKPILTGPHTFNAEDIASLFANEGALAQVRDASELAAQIIDWFEHPQAAAVVGARGLELVEKNRGALERLLALVHPLLTSTQARR